MLATGQGLRSLRDLTQHLTTRADDSHAAPVSEFPKAPIHLWKVLHVKASEGSSRCFGIKPHAPPLVRAPSIHLSFNLAAVLPRRSTYRAAPLRSQGSQRLVDIVYGVDYQGINLFAPHAFAPQCQISVQVVAFAMVSFLYLRISPLRKFPPSTVL